MIRDDARQEAEVMSWSAYRSDVQPNRRTLGRESVAFKAGFQAGAVWASEQADPEPDDGHDAKVRADALSNLEPGELADLLQGIAEGLTGMSNRADLRRAAGVLRLIAPDEDQGPAAGCAYCVGAGGYEDHDGSWVECSCQQPDREPTPEEEREELANLIPLGFEARDGVRNVLEAADRILAAGFRKTDREPSSPVHVQVASRASGKQSALADMIVERANAKGVRVEFVAPDREPSEAEIEAFRAAWHQADAEGDKGNRVKRGLLAAWEVRRADHP